MRRFILEAPSIIVAILLLMAPGLVPLVAADIKESAVDYNRDVRPILAENCYACHGPDSGTREAGLRLDRQDDATAEYAIGKRAIVPGSPEESVVIARITASDPREVMPPPKSGKALTPEEIDTIRRWIASGAEWKEHWSYVPPKRPAVPAVRASERLRTPVDAFIVSRLEREGVEPSPEADRVTLLRRLSFDLLGLPPTTEEIDSFLADTSERAYEERVERLLRSPHYGERMAIFWLDLVRFADTRGYHSDNPRNVSPYRDWVIRSFNENMPFDRFTIAQLAGDLLPEPTLWDRVASGYNKLSQTTEEGGAQAKEYEAKTSADRVRNVSVVWMGATMGCAECHDHKFDPWTMKDFYSLAAFFADIEEPAIMDRDRGIPVPVTSAQESELRALDLRIESLRDRLASPPPEVAKTLGEARIAWETEVRAGSSGGGDAPPEEIRTILAKAEVDRSDAERRKLDEHWLAIAPPLAAVREELAAAEKEREKLVASLPRCLVAKSGAPRTVRILPRGNWMDDTGEVVEPAVPAYFGRLDVEGRPTRLDLARWLVSTENPLTARVLVNRLWKLFFGAGISRGLEDLGAMGEPPSHPDLLDWLAVELVESGWDVKHMVRLMVLSSTYRQSSAGRADLASRDPYNRLLARQSRWRLDAELVRDNALAVSGLLSREIGGPSVFPYQPPGYWVNLNFPKREWKNDSGDNQWRRGLYTWWQRSFVHPSLLAFDAPSREECVAERPRSNIPQQALVLLNDPTYVEAARVFATRILADGGDTDETRIRWGFRRATSRKPEANEVAILADLLERHRASWAADPEGASELLAVGQATKPDGAEAIEVAAWTSIARVLLNLHETITRN